MMYCVTRRRAIRSVTPRVYANIRKNPLKVPVRGGIAAGQIRRALKAYAELHEQENGICWTEFVSDCDACDRHVNVYFSNPEHHVLFSLTLPAGTA